ncbi:monocarboxylate transporter 13-like [Patiria miniata]|uniref:Major facilitator superfamily (MFS) profile domain-containing protein n=1 Tax=Patiria miniata TaxID=46514 RepID=A0A913ZQ10_PATMI|nr:monocarboxylate transporter 13-like [Patiria miniata]
MALHRRKGARRADETTDGGLASWLVVVNTLISLAVWGGVNKSYGVMFFAIRDDFSTSTWIMGWVVAVMSFSVDMFSPIVNLLERKFGTRQLLVVGSLMLSVGVIMASLTTHPSQMALLSVLVVGPGLACSTVVSRALLGRCWTRRYSLACAIAYNGIPLSLLFFGPVSQALLDVYGWRGAIMIIGAITVHLVLISTALKLPPIQEYARLPGNNCTIKQTTCQKSKSTRAGATELTSLRLDDADKNEPSCLRGVIRGLDLSLLVEADFLCLSWMSFCVRFDLEAWMIYYVSHAGAKGIAINCLLS